MREPRLSCAVCRFVEGITPACAGTTACRHRPRRSPRDHPRVCGNHVFSRSASSSIRGSPPRVREPHVAVAVSEDVSRITPACAGTTSHSFQNRFQDEDHPRVCGNHVLVLIRFPLLLGSPPRVREPHRMRIQEPVAHRITPACAGTTPFTRIVFRRREDHPRVCGNH